MAAAPPVFDADPSMKCELHISCQQLVNLDATSLSDPLVCVRMKTNGGAWTEVGRTELIKDCLDPVFVKAISIKYRFEATQPIQFTVYDVDDAKCSLDRADFIGAVETTLAEIITNRAGVFTAQLAKPSHPGQRRGSIRVVAEEIREGNDDVALCFAADNLDKKDLFGKSDPYLQISQIREGGVVVAVHKTEVIEKTLAPRWKPFIVRVQALCNGDYDRPLRIECFDWNKRSPHELIGTCETSLRQLLAKPASLSLIPPKKGKKPTAGTLNLTNIELIRNPTFIEFLKGGCEISLIVAIDFTASNGPPNLPQSLHFMGNPSAPNAYVQAISSVGSILAAYDRDGRFPVYGFGARMPDGSVSHCFSLNGNPSNPEVEGVAGILQAYTQAISATTLYGPTLFAQIINTAGQIAAMNSQDVRQQKYFVLLIITDGEVNDMQATIDQLVYASNNLPLSVVIVGVGNADFGKMATLDADDQALRGTDGSTASRDIVQFVPFNRYAGNPGKLAEETLAEIPQQLLAFFKKRGIKPNPAPTVTYAPPPTAPPP